MLNAIRSRLGAYQVYLITEFATALFLAVIYTTAIVYRVESAHLNPLELVLIGTVLEAAYMLMQVPTGLVADVYSRKWSVIIGYLVLGVAFLFEGLLPFFVAIAIAQVVRALGFALISGAQEAWIADEVGEDQTTRVYLRGSQVALIGTLVGTVLSGLIALVRVNAPFIVGGTLFLLLGGFLVLAMRETNPPYREHRDGERPSVWQGVGKGSRDTLTQAWRLVRAHPVVLAIFGVV
ncbi:MAG: MFS transporter, partial [Actinomycetota bacterium]|nr:MFS transporter [Actinomycetota bacterium]